MRNRGKRWEEDEENNMIRELQHKMPLEQIAEVHERSLLAIQMRLGQRFHHEMQQDHRTLSDLGNLYKLPEVKIEECISKWTTSSSSSSSSHGSNPPLSRRPSYEDRFQHFEQKMSSVEEHLLTLARQLESINHRLRKVHRSIVTKGETDLRRKK